MHRCVLTLPGVLSLDNTPPTVAAIQFSSPDRTYLKTGDEVSIKLSIEGTALIPTVTLFNGAATATASQITSPYTFTYVIQEENGPIEYQVKAVDEAGNELNLNLAHPGRIAGIQTKPESITLDTAQLSAHGNHR